MIGRSPPILRIHQPFVWLIRICVVSVLLVSFGGGTSGSLAATQTASKHKNVLALKNLFERAINRVDEIRKRDRSTSIDVTSSFFEFYRSDQIETYVDFFESIGVPAKNAVIGPRTFVHFDLYRDQLNTNGRRAFARGDKLVVVFTVDPARLNVIKTFKVTLLNPEVF